MALGDGSMVLPIEATFPIGSIGAAVAVQQAGHVRGTVGVTMP